jgi:long-chain acyl-CoA synthetase
VYPGQRAIQRADQPAVIMAGSGETVTCRELAARSNRLAHLLRAAGLKRLDHYAIFMENHPRFVECCAAGERSGLYYTALNSFLTAGELAYIVNNSLSKVLITSEAKREVARAPLRDCPKVELLLIVDGSRRERVRNLAEATAEFPATPISDARLGATMLYSSGATGRPKGVLRPLPDQAPDEPLSALAARLNVWRFREGQVYLSPAPLYHSAPLAGVGGTIRRGGAVVVMELRAGRVV